MRSTKRFAFMAVAILVVLIVSIKPAPEAQGASSEVLRFNQGESVLIGVGAVLSGEYAHLGREIIEGVQMAIDEMKYLLGHKIELIAEDDMCEPGPTREAARKLLSRKGVVGVIGYMCSPGTLAALELHEQRKMALISATSSDFMLTSKGSPIIFRTRWNDLLQGKGLALYAAKKGLKRAVIFHDDSASSIAIVESFQEDYQQKMGHILYKGGLPKSNPELKALVRGLKIKWPNLVYFAGGPEQALELQREIKEARLKAHVFYDDRCLDQKDFIKEGGKLLEGIHVMTIGLPEGKHYADWIHSYRSSYGEPGVYSASAYDAARVLLQAVSWTAAMEPDGSISIDKAKLLESIRYSKIEGATGRIQFDENGDRTSALWRLFRVARGSLKPATTLLLP